MYVYIYIHVDCTSHSISRDVSNYRNNKNLFPLPLSSSSSVSHSVVSDSLRPHGLSPTRLLCPWDSPGKNTGMGCHSLLQGIFLTQRSNPDLPHCRQILYHLSHQGRPHTETGSDQSFEDLSPLTSSFLPPSTPRRKVQSDCGPERLQPTHIIPCSAPIPVPAESDDVSQDPC